MLGHTKELHIKEPRYIDVRVEFPEGKAMLYHIPSTASTKLNEFLKKLDMSKDAMTAWEEAVPWEVMAQDRIKKHSKAGLALRGARYRAGLSQKELALKSGVHQNEISKMENGKRGIGEKVAKRLAKALEIDYRLLLVIK